MFDYLRKGKTFLDKLELMAKQLKAVSDLNRLKLLACLKKGELCACDFVGVLQVSQPAVSQQLKKLKEAEIIVERPAGIWKHYRLSENLPPYIQSIIDHLVPISIIKCNC